MTRKKRLQPNEFKANVRAAVSLLRIAFRERPFASSFAIIGGVFQTSASILTIYATARLTAALAAFATGTQNQDTIWFWLAITIAASIIANIGRWIVHYTERLVYFAINIWAVNQFLRTMSVLDIADFYDTDTRNRVNKVGGSYTWQMSSLSYNLFALIRNTIQLLAIAVIVTQIQWWVIMLIFICLIPSLVSDSITAKIAWSIWGEKGDNRHVFAGISDQMTRPQKQMEMRSMQTSAYLLRRVANINQSFHDHQEKRFRAIASRLGLPATTLEVIGVAIGSIILIQQFIHGTISLEQYLFLSGALLQINGALGMIFGTLSNMQESLHFAKEYFAVTNLQPTITDVENARVIKRSTIPSIEFDNVTFTYPGSSSPVFENLSFRINAGEHLAIVGENGAGKTTFIKLLMRFYTPDSGRILIDGTDLRDVAVESWYRQLATLFQDFNQYPLSVRENIYIARPNRKRDEQAIEQAAQFGGVDAIVREYEHGWDTVLDASFKKGVEPSGGQWQRVALARAFFRDANILILDEPTAAIDAKAEYDIFNNIFEHYQQKTAIIISHRFSTVRRAHTILVMEHGKIIEHGSHRALMRKHGLYHSLFSKQAEGYKD